MSSAITPLVNGISQSQLTVPAASAAGQRTFQQVMREVQSGLGLGGPGLHRDLITMQQQLLSGRNLPLTDLMRYQIKASELHLRVELLSKVADSALSGVRRLQDGRA